MKALLTMLVTISGTISAFAGATPANHCDMWNPFNHSTQCSTSYPKVCVGSTFYNVDQSGDCKAVHAAEIDQCYTDMLGQDDDETIMTKEKIVAQIYFPTQVACENRDAGSTYDPNWRVTYPDPCFQRDINGNCTQGSD